MAAPAFLSITANGLDVHASSILFAIRNYRPCRASRNESEAAFRKPDRQWIKGSMAGLPSPGRVKQRAKLSISGNYSTLIDMFCLWRRTLPAVPG
jgi:hypothetical protein